MKHVVLLYMLVILSCCTKNIKPLTPSVLVQEPYFITQRFGANFFNENEFTERMSAAKRLGIDFIRLTPSKWQSLRPGAKAGEFLVGDREQYHGLYHKDLDQLKQILDIAHQARLKVVLTFLNVPGRIWRQHNNNITDCRLWRDFKFHDQTGRFFADISLAIGNHPGLVAINPINEPEPEHCHSTPIDWADSSAYRRWYQSVENSPSDLNVLYRNIQKNIRNHNSFLTLIFDSSFYATPAALPFLTPQNDPNIIYSFHMYEPYQFTFQKGSTLSYPGMSPLGELGNINQNWNRAALEPFLSPIKEWQTKFKLPNNRIMVGEFGVDRLAKGAEIYLADLIYLFNANRWHWAFYSFREYGFTKFDYEMGDQKAGWNYWQQIEKKKHPNYSLYQKSNLLKILTDGMSSADNLQNIKKIAPDDSKNYELDFLKPPVQ
jgi:endoglucanase